MVKDQFSFSNYMTEWLVYNNSLISLFPRLSFLAPLWAVLLQFHNLKGNIIGAITSENQEKESISRV